jgi:hypothetical protein
MISQAMNRLGKVAAAGLMVATIGLGLTGGAGPAHAQDNQGGGFSWCSYNGFLYPEGASVTMDDGWLYTCKDGSWVRFGSIPLTSGVSRASLNKAGLAK